MTYIEETDFKETVMQVLAWVLFGLLLIGLVVFANGVVRDYKSTEDCVSKMR